MIRELAALLTFVALVIGGLGYFSTMQIEHGKKHTHYQEATR